MPKMTAGPSKPKKRKIKHIRIEGSKKKGFTVSHQYHPKAGGHGMMHGYEPDPQPQAFSAGPDAKAQMMAHVGGLADQMGEPDGDEAV
jgi:hypothetical protein